MGRVIRHMVLMVIAVGLAVPGCSSSKPAPFTPTDPVVDWRDLSDGGNVRVEDNYRLLTDRLTTGVFPASIAVARLAGDPGATGKDRLMLDMSPQVDFLAWNSCFDDFRAISEVFPVNIMAMNGAPVKIPHVLENAQALRAGLLLVYAENQPARNRYEMSGVLYDVDQRRRLASIHVPVELRNPVSADTEFESDDPALEATQRDPRFVARRRFENLTRDCLLALMANDEPADPVNPDGWIPDRPIERIFWPPPDELSRYLRR